MCCAVGEISDNCGFGAHESTAEEDFAAAVELKPANEALKLALKQIRELMQQEERGRDAQKGSASDDRSLE